MCGVAGELRFSSQPSEADWKKISELMAKRGPDDCGYWHDERCNLAFRRLAILDLSEAGHQPMLSPDGRYAIVFNGEIYNFKELRQQLEQQGVIFRSHGDSEVVLYSLREWGRDALDRFNGMFALAFYDTHERKLLLARDHAGIKPLYLLHNSKGIVFASQYDQVLAHPWSKNLPYSPEAVALYLHLAFIPAPYGILKNTSMLEPGSWLEVDSHGSILQGHYYDFPRYQIPTLRGPEALEAVDATITAAVKRQMVSDVPLGAFLSGGIDSPLVCAKMQIAGKDQMHAFTFGASGDKIDESEDAIRYARQLGIDQTVEQASTDDAVNLLDDVINACGEPFGDFSIFPTLLISRLARKKFTVMLSGDGGDELFWGYSQRVGLLINNVGDFRYPWWWRRLLRPVRRLSHLPIMGSYQYRTIGNWQRAMHTHLPAKWLYRIFPDMPSWPQDFDLFDYAGRDSDDMAQWVRKNEFSCHLTGVLLKVDRASMYNSLEVRVPLLDREVINVAAQLDWQDCFDPIKNIGKLPLRESLARHLHFQTTAKKGFEPPMNKWLQTSLAPVVQDTLLSRESLAGIPLDKTALRGLYQQLSEGLNYGWGFWPLLSLALWQKKYNR